MAYLHHVVELVSPALYSVHALTQDTQCKSAHDSHCWHRMDTWRLIEGRDKFYSIVSSYVLANRSSDTCESLLTKIRGYSNTVTGCSISTFILLVGERIICTVVGQLFQLRRYSCELKQAARDKKVRYWGWMTISAIIVSTDYC